MFAFTNVHLKMLSAANRSFYVFFEGGDQLTHCGRVTYTLVNYAIIGCDNGLSPIRPQAIIWTNSGALSIVHIKQGRKGLGRNANILWVIDTMRWQTEAHLLTRINFDISVDNWLDAK